MQNPGGAAVPSSAPSVSSTADFNCARPAQDQQAELAARAAAAGSNGAEAGFRASATAEREDRDDGDSIFGDDGDAEEPHANGMTREVRQRPKQAEHVCHASPPPSYVCAMRCGHATDGHTSGCGYMANRHGLHRAMNKIKSPTSRACWNTP